jgi:fructose-specific component phosphotransferase system IIB-like protein
MVPVIRCSLLEVLCRRQQHFLQFLSIDPRFGSNKYFLTAQAIVALAGKEESSRFQRHVDTIIVFTANISSARSLNKKRWQSFQSMEHSTFG